MLAQPIPTPAPKEAPSLPGAYGPITRECATSASYTHTITPASTSRSYMHHIANKPQNST